MKRNAISKKHSVLDILRSRAVNGEVVLPYPVATRPQPVKKSLLRDHVEDMRRLKSEGKSFNQIADWLFIITGKRPDKSTVCRQLQQATIAN